jgi:hypothetical protein
MKRKKTQISKIRNVKEEITTNTKEIQGIKTTLRTHIPTYFPIIIILNGEKLKPFPLKSAMRQG